MPIATTPDTRAPVFDVRGVSRIYRMGEVDVQTRGGTRRPLVEA